MAAAGSTAGAPTWASVVASPAPMPPEDRPRQHGYAGGLQAAMQDALGVQPAAPCAAAPSPPHAAAGKRRRDSPRLPQGPHAQPPSARGDYCHTSWTTTAAFRRLSQASPRRTTRPTSLRVSRPQTVLATSLGYSTPSEPIIPPTNSSASPKFTRCRQAACTASNRSHTETSLQGHNCTYDRVLLQQSNPPSIRS